MIYTLYLYWLNKKKIYYTQKARESDPLSIDKASNRTRLRDDQEVRTDRDLKLTLMNMVRDLMEKMDNVYDQRGILKRKSDFMINRKEMLELDTYTCGCIQHQI